jgi:heat shock protein HslJ
MKTTIRFLMAAVLAVGMTGWAAANDENRLTNTRWRLVSFTESNTESPALEGPDVMLEFRTNGRVGGSGGCNSFGGEYTAQGDRLEFGAVMSTKRACMDEGRMQQEQRFFQALQSARSFELAEGTLKVSYDEGRGVLTFARADAVN